MVSKNVVPDLGKPIRKMGFGLLSGFFKVGHFFILDFLELSWDDAVLNYLITAKKRDRIATPSYAQVIKPIYSYAIGRWKRYRKQTTNIYPILEGWIKKFNY